MVTVAAIRTTRKFARVAVRFTATLNSPDSLRGGLRIDPCGSRGRNVGRLCRPHFFFSFTSGGRGSSRSLKGRVSAAMNQMSPSDADSAVASEPGAKLAFGPAAIGIGEVLDHVQTAGEASLPHVVEFRKVTKTYNPGGPNE